GRLDTERDFGQTGRLHGADQLLIEIVHARLALKSDAQAACADRFGDLETAVAVEREQRVTYLDVATGIERVKLGHLGDDRRDRAGAKTRRDTMRTVGAMLRATAARQHRERAFETETAKVGVAEAFGFDQVPTWKGQRVE